jgi:putative Holliday junction resolvase
MSKKRILGIDYGLARLGISLSDEMKAIAFPYKVLHTKRSTISVIQMLKGEIGLMPSPIEEIVIGLPLMMSGKIGLLADDVKHFADILREQLSYPVVLWDERLTTVQAERSLRESSMSRKKRSQLVDSVAAVLILQSYLDYKNTLKS